MTIGLLRVLSLPCEWQGHDRISLAPAYTPDDAKKCRKSESCKFGNCAPYECAQDIAGCEARFAVHKQALLKLSEHGVPTVWQSLFPIHAHPILTNQFLHSDYLCQKLVAKRAGILVGDVPKITGLESWRANGVSGDWHLNKEQVRKMVEVILQALQAAAAGRPIDVGPAVSTVAVESDEQLLALLKSNAGDGKK